MSSDVVLSAALRNNLLSLQNTQTSINTAQLALSTGKKVNSALDNPQSFFAAQSLTDRANDLNKLLDSIGQSIEVIKAADNGVTALTGLVNQAQALAQSAQSAVADGSTQAAAVGNVSLNASTLLNTLTGFSTSGDAIQVTITDPATGTLVVNGTIGLGTAVGGSVGTAANWTVQDLIDNINDINSRAGTGNNAPLPTAAISASLDSSGHLNLTAVNGGTLHIAFVSANATVNKAATSLAIANSLGFGSIAKDDLLGAGAAGSTDSVDFTSRASASITSNKLYVNGSGTLAQLSTLLTSLKDSAGTAITNLTAAADTLNLKIGGKTSGDLLHYTSTGGTSYSATTTTIGALIDAINHDSTINTLVTASFNSATGQISLTALDPSATDIQFQFGGAAAESLSTATATYPTGLGFGTQALTTAALLKAQEDVRFGAAAGQLASLQTQYGTVISQINALVTNGDTGYAGTNLLNGDNLLTTFNEQRTSTLTTVGATFTSGGLGITSANFGNSTTVNNSITQLNNALGTIRNFGSSLATNLSVIQTRQTFANSLIITLNEGAGNLVNADQNAEGATLLALQTRQSLGVTALSLASQSNQSILRLFQ